MANIATVITMAATAISAAGVGNELVCGDSAGCCGFVRSFWQVRFEVG